MSSQKIALITGITGQDGSYLAEFLLSKGYVVHGIKRRSSSLNTERIDHIYEDPFKENKNFHLHYGDLSDGTFLIDLINFCKPHEIYNLAAQSHVGVSFENPIYTADIDALGPLRILEAIRILSLEKHTKFYQASSSELYGLVQETPQSETTPFYPRSPYGVSKLFAYWITVNYRESYDIFAANGILFNHESPRRGETFVTRKITRQLTRIFLGLEKCLYLGNLDSLRDWGHARDYVEMQWLILQQNKPVDYVIATGKQSSVRGFVSLSAKHLGFEIEFHGKNIEEVGVISKINSDEYKGSLKEGDVIIKVSPKYFRPAEVDTLLGNFTKAHNDLGWKPKYSLEDLCKEMINADLKIAQKELILQNSN